ASAQGVQAVSEVFRFVLGGAFDLDISEFCDLIQRHLEIDIGQLVRFIQVNLGSHFGLKVPVALEEGDKRCLCFLDVDGGVRLLLDVISDLDQSRIREMFRARESIHSEVDGRLQDKDNPYAFLFRTKVELDVREFSCALKRR